MSTDTKVILDLLLNSISSMDEVESIGISGSKTPLPKAGEGDIDVFIYCNHIPSSNTRQGILDKIACQLEDCRINVFEGGHWGTGDLVFINGVETWLMYFTVNETMSDAEDILKGRCPDKLDNYYYPIGRIAMLQNINILFDRNHFLFSLKERLSEYPDELSKILTEYHLGKLDDVEDLERAVVRKDVLFYHFAMDIALDHFLQALFAVNKIFFPSRKRSLNYISQFKIKPDGCGERLLEVIRLGSCSEGIEESYQLWSKLVEELKRRS